MARPKDSILLPENDPLWYKDAIIYELHIKAFFDSSGDGIGDFKGLTEKLDYLEDLGITVVWLLPFYPSPMRDDGYDIADYSGVHQDYGRLKDFKEFLREAHRRKIRVITELVINHTSDQHPWFRKARQAKPGTAAREFYVWSDTAEKYLDARIIFQDFESSNWSWDPVAGAYYWHRFYSHQPDLNFDSLQMQRALFKVLDHWLGMGVDGLRLDAIPYLYEREGTNCENLPETHEFLKKFRAHVDGNFRDKMLLAEANQWPEDAVAYFGQGDECHMCFHFPLMPRIFMSCWMEDRFPIIDILDQTPLIPENCQWALFLRNHDELTLEMVSDEERDYMYRVYARDAAAKINLGIRRRLAPLLGNQRRKIELVNFLLFSLPGTPVIYYGDEIGMGDNFYLGDRNGVRTPMQWSADLNAGFSKANPQKLYLPVITDPEYRYEAVNVASMERNRSSLLWWMKRLIAMRKNFKAFSRGQIEFLHPDNPKILAFIRSYENEEILVLVNLSRYSQVAELDLSKYAGCFLEEVFGRNRFPSVTEEPYHFTLGFYDYFWFLIKREEGAISLEKTLSERELDAEGSWPRILQKGPREKLEKKILPDYIKRCPWFLHKTRRIRSCSILDEFQMGAEAHIRLLILTVDFLEGLPETYFLPLSLAIGETARWPAETYPQSVVATLGDNGILYDAAYDPEFREHLLQFVTRRKPLAGKQGEISGHGGPYLKKIKNGHFSWEKTEVLEPAQRNTSFLYGKDLHLKLFRRLDEGQNPDVEIGRFLTEKNTFQAFPKFAGSIEYRAPGSGPMILGILQAYVPNEGTAWTYTLHAAEQYFERVMEQKNEMQGILDLVDACPESSFPAVDIEEVPQLLQELIGGFYLEMVTILARRTAELHLTLFASGEDRNFTPEPFSLLYQRSLYQSMQSLTKRVFNGLRRNIKDLPETAQERAGEILALQPQILDKFKALVNRKLSAMKTRIHGNFHLDQVFYTGNDFVIFDFEGEPLRSVNERRLKVSPIRDVAGMIRSFHYAIYSAFQSFSLRIPLRSEALQWLELSADLWHQYVSGVFLRAYLDGAGEADYLPGDREEIDLLLKAFLLEKAIYELNYELDSRPDRALIPMTGIEHLLEF